MLDQQPKYENYKDSGIPWLSEVPAEWDIQRAKWLFSKMERPVRPEDDVVTAFRDGQVTLRTNRRTEGFTNAIQEHGYQGIRTGDLVIHAMDAFAGAIGVSESDGKSSPVYAACVPRGLFDVSPRYYAYALRYVALSGYILSLAKGIRERSTDFRFKDFGEMDMPVPDLNTQNRIVSFLDEKTAEIDAAIAKKRRLIDLLNEQKAILINRAVTKGLNPDAPMKDSGVDWIGEIPAHWDVKRVKHGFRFEKGKDAQQLTKDYIGQHSGTYPVYSGQTENDGVLGLLNRYAYDLPTCIFVTTVGAKAMTPRLLSGKFSLSQNCLIMLPDQRLVETTYFCGLLETIFTFEKRKISTHMQESLRIGDLKNFDALYPPLDEQREISRHISFLEEQFEPAFESSIQEISALNEFKQTLIANAVTGKIKI